jgi:hypothetical protein
MWAVPTSSYMICQSYWKMYHWQSEHECGTCMMVLRHILAVLCEMFSVTCIMSEGQVEEDPLRGLQDHPTWILWIFTCGAPRNRCIFSSFWQQTDTSPSHCGCLSDYPQLPRHLWTDVAVHDETSWLLLKLMENILGTCYECILSAIIHKLNVSEYMLLRTLFLALLCGTSTQNLSTSFSYILYILLPRDIKWKIEITRR